LLGDDALAGMDAERLDTPGWLWSSWQRAYGSAVRAIAAANARPAPLDLTLKFGMDGPVGGARLPTGTWRMPHGTTITDLAGFDEGRFWAQDAAAALPASLLEPHPGMRVLDMCAAPGGKTAQLAAARAQVVALDKDPARIEDLRRNLDRLHLCATLEQADATSWSALGGFDAVLVDAPCSGTGTIRRHPDLPHLRRPSDIGPLQALQCRLLANAAQRVRKGGTVIYATCSLQHDEGEAVASGVDGLAVHPVREYELPGLACSITPNGYVRVRPDMWAEMGGLDGFFVARFKRD
jgi:16S rRNA (cytosine967-C5)-methyltransferase